MVKKEEIFVATFHLIHLELDYFKQMNLEIHLTEVS